MTIIEINHLKRESPLLLRDYRTCNNIVMTLLYNYIYIYTSLSLYIAFAHTHTHTHTHTRTHTHTLTLTHTCAHTLKHTHTQDIVLVWYTSMFSYHLPWVAYVLNNNYRFEGNLTAIITMLTKTKLDYEKHD